MLPRVFNRKLIPTAVLALLLCTQIVNAQGTSFTYQGKLSNSGNPATGSFDIQFKVFDALTEGTQQGDTVTNPAVQATAGIFTVELDFGAEVFDGTARYLEICVRPAGSPNPYTVLAPRQSITSTPYALHSMKAAAADGLSAACVNCVTGEQVQSIDGAQITGVVAGSQINGAIPIESVPIGSNNYIQNSVVAARPGKAGAQQAGGFNIEGDGVVGGTLSANLVESASQYNLAGNRILSNAGNNNLFVGVSAGEANSTGSDNSFFGAFAGQANQAGSSNSFFGVVAGFNNNGNDNSFFGRSAGFTNTTGGSNAFFGVQAGRDNSTGSANSFFGRAAGITNVTASGNSFFGFQAGGSNRTGGGNSFFGNCAGCSTTTGSSNSFFGSQTALNNVTGGENSFFGAGIGGLNTNGFGNSFFGYNAAQTIALGSGNSFFGSQAGYLINSGTAISLFGYATNAADGIFRATAIGVNAYVSQTDSLVLGSINGVNGATFNTSVGIGTTAPQQILHVNGNEILSTGSFAGFKFRDRGSASSADDWVLYSQGNVARLFRQGQDLITILSDGAVTIKNLSGGGSIALCRTALNLLITCSSSLRYKKDVESFSGGLEIVSRLRPIRFTWKEGGRDIGFAAEEVEQIEPLLTFRNDKGEIEGVKYSQISAVLVNAIKAQQAQIQQQQRQIDALTKLVCQTNSHAEVCQATRER